MLEGDSTSGESAVNGLIRNPPAAAGTLRLIVQELETPGESAVLSQIRDTMELAGAAGASNAHDLFPM